MKLDLSKTDNAVLRQFRARGGILRTSEARRLGIHQQTIQNLAKRNLVEPLARGLYRLSEAPIPESPDLTVVAKKVPSATLCLISALSFHGLTTQIPHEIYIMLPREKSTPKLEWPPLRVFRSSGKCLTSGVETHEINGIPIKVYSPEKTVADCFKFRNKIGLDVAIEALKDYLDRKGASRAKLMEYARICRVERIITPYLEALQ